MIPFIFALIQRVKTGLFSKSCSTSFMYWRFIYDAMQYWIMRRQGYFIFVIGSAPIISVPWSLAENLFIVWPTCCSWHITQAATSTPQFAHAKLWFSGKKLVLVVIHETHGTISHGNQKVHSGSKALTCLWHTFLSSLKQGAGTVGYTFLPSVVGLLQAITAFGFKFFSLAWLI